MPSTKSGHVLPKAKHGATCVHIEGAPKNVFGLKIPGNDDPLLVAKRRTRRWSSCSKLNDVAKKLPLQENASVWQCCEEHHFGNHFPAQNQLAHHLPAHCRYTGDLSVLEEEPAPQKPQRPHRGRVSGIQQPYEKNLHSPNEEQYEDEEEEEPKRKRPEALLFDTRSVLQLTRPDSPETDPMIDEMGFTVEQIKLLEKASKKMSPFSATNIHKPWLARHCKLLGKDRVIAALRESINTMQSPGQKGRRGKRA